MKKPFYSFWTLLFVLLFMSQIALGQSEMSSDNKIGVVGGVVVIIFVIILLYLLRLEKKISYLEKNQGGEE